MKILSDSQPAASVAAGDRSNHSLERKELDELRAEVSRLRAALDKLQSMPLASKPMPERPVTVQKEPPPPAAAIVIEPEALIVPISAPPVKTKRAPKPSTKTVLFDPLWQHVKKPPQAS